MNGLTRLQLRANQIRLTPRSIRILEERVSLKILVLDNNPLGRLPDFSSLVDLRGLSLRGAWIDTWPTGLRDQPLEQIDLRGNLLTDVPAELTDPPAERAHATARLNGVTLLQGNPLSEATQQRLREYWANLCCRIPSGWPCVGPVRLKRSRYRAPPRCSNGCETCPGNSCRTKPPCGKTWRLKRVPRSFSSC